MSNRKLYINHSLIFTNGQISVNGKTIFEQNSEENYVALSKRIFRSLENSYAKYHKMDRLSKLAYLSGELLLKEINLEQYNKENVALLFSNSSATIETDKKFQESISSIPSPAIFVYTLPNIMIGELCIRFGLKGENLFFIEPELNTELLTEQTEMLFDNSPTELCMVGWVDFYSTEHYNCNLALISRDEKGFELSSENLMKCFNQEITNG